jgi:predicted transcriptional regulator
MGVNFLALAKKTASKKYLVIAGTNQDMKKQSAQPLSKREQQIMDIIYSRGQATAAEVLENLPDPPSYSAVRALLRVLVDKGHLLHRQEGQRYIYHPTVEREKVKHSALQRVLKTFFGGSAEEAVAALLDISEKSLSDDELKRMEEMIKQARKEGR